MKYKGEFFYLEIPVTFFDVFLNWKFYYQIEWISLFVEGISIRFLFVPFLETLNIFLGNAGESNVFNLTNINETLRKTAIHRFSNFKFPHLSACIVLYQKKKSVFFSYFFPFSFGEMKFSLFILIGKQKKMAKRFYLGIILKIVKMFLLLVHIS